MDLLGMYVESKKPLEERYIGFDSRFKASRQGNRITLEMNEDKSHPICTGLWDKTLRACAKGNPFPSRSSIRNVNLVIGENGSGKTTMIFLIGRMIRQLKTGELRSGHDDFSGFSLWMEPKTDAEHAKQRIYLFYTAPDEQEVHVIIDQYDVICLHVSEARAFLPPDALPFTVLTSNSLENRFSGSTPMRADRQQFSELEHPEPEYAQVQEMPLSDFSEPTLSSPELKIRDLIDVEEYTPQVLLQDAAKEFSALSEPTYPSAAASVPRVNDLYFAAQIRWIVLYLWVDPNLEAVRAALELSIEKADDKQNILDQVCLTLMSRSPDSGNGQQPRTFWEREIQAATSALAPLLTKTAGDPRLIADFDVVTQLIAANGCSEELENELTELVNRIQEKNEFTLQLDALLSKSDNYNNDQLPRMADMVNQLSTLLSIKQLFRWEVSQDGQSVSLRQKAVSEAVEKEGLTRVRQAVERFLQLFLQVPVENGQWTLPSLRLDGSSGQINYLMMMANLIHAVTYIQTRQILLLVDEADLSYHPEWQRTFLLRLLYTLRGLPFEEWHIIIATHSPILLSDFPKASIIQLHSKQDHKEKETFAQNIYTLYQDRMYLTSAAGSFAQAYLQTIADDIQALNDQQTIADDIQALNDQQTIADDIQTLNDQQAARDSTSTGLQERIEMIGDPMLKHVYDYNLKKALKKRNQALKKRKTEQKQKMMDALSGNKPLSEEDRATMLELLKGI